VPVVVRSGVECRVTVNACGCDNVRLYEEVGSCEVECVDLNLPMKGKGPSFLCKNAHRNVELKFVKMTLHHPYVSTCIHTLLR